MSVKERLKIFIKSKGMRVSPFERSINVSIGYVSSISKGIGTDKLKTIAETYPDLNITWLTTGVGEMLLSTVVNEVDLIAPNYLRVPVVNVSAQAGFLSGYGDVEYMESLPVEYWEVDHEYKGRYFVFEVKGDSMEDGTLDSVLAGDKLLCREINPDYWKSPLHINKWNFVIVSKEHGIIVKRIIKHDVEAMTITCHSLNDYYSDQVIHLSEVKSLLNVVDFKRSAKIK